MTLRTFRISKRWSLFVAGWWVAGLIRVAPVFAVEPSLEYSLRQWHVQSEWANDEVLQLSQDQAGYLRVGSDAGLGRFDGSQFRFTAFAAEGLPEGATLAVMVDAPGFGFVLAPTTGGLWVEKLHQVERATFAADLGDRPVIALFVAPDRALWAGCSDGTIFRYAEDGGQKFVVPRGLPGPRKIGFATDAHSRVWITSDLNLLRYDGGQLHREGDFEGVELRIASSRQDGPWILTPDRLYKFTNSKFEVQASLPPLLGAHYVQALVEDRRDVLWLGTRSNGLHAFENRELKAWAEIGEDVSALLEDREGNVWVGTNGDGLARLRPKNYQLINKSSGLLVDFSTTVCEDLTGNIWIANRDGGLVSWRDGILTKHGPLPDWPAYSAVSVFPRAEGGVFFTCGSGVYRIASTTADAVIAKETDFPALPIIRCTFVASNGDVWFSVDPGKLGRRRNQHCDIFSLPEASAASEIRAIAETIEGNLLLATSGGELLSFDGQKCSSLLPELHPRWGALQTILVQPDGSILLGTEQAGVVQWRRDGRIRQCGVDRGMMHNNITQIIPDNFGNLWFGSAGGIFRIEKANFLRCLEGGNETVRPLVISQDREASELACIAQYQPAAWKARDGRLWFATRRGLLELNPATEMAPLKPAVTSIDEVRSDGKIVPRSPLIELSSDFRKIEVHFSALSLSTPERVRLEYQLVGFDHDWMDATADRTATYPRLPPGRYPFRVAARMVNDAATVSTATLELVIVPYWWQTWWFRSLALAAVVALLIQIVRVWSHRRLQRTLANLERAGAIERERSRIARNIHDEVGASLTRISLLTQSGARAATNDSNILTKIHQTTREVTRSLDEIVWAIDPRHDNLESLAAYFVSYAQNFLGAAGLRCRLEIPADLPPSEPTTQIRHNLFLCQREALHNIVKHAQATEVVLSLDLRGSVLRLTIADDGVGFESAVRTGDKASVDADRISAGNGVANMRHHIEEVGGKMEIGPGPQGRGTSITWTVELNRTKDI